MLHLLGALTGVQQTPLAPAADLAIQQLAPGSSKAGMDLGYAIEIDHRADGDLFEKGGNTPSYTAFLAFRRSPRSVLS